MDVTTVEREAASFKFRDFREGRFAEIYGGFEYGPFIGYFSAWQSLQTIGMGTCGIVESERKSEGREAIVQLPLLSDRANV